MDEVQVNYIELKGLNKIFIGNLLFLIGSILSKSTIILGIVGCYLIIAGLSEFTKYHKHFKLAIIFTTLLMITNGIRIFQPHIEFSELPYYFLLLMIATMFIQIFVDYHVFYGLYELGKIKNNEIVQHDAKATFRFLLVANMMLTIVMTLYWINSSIFSICGLFAFAIAIPTQILYLTSFKQIKNSFNKQVILPNEPSIQTS